jgi:tRNA 5-methylaminomethyl-2-thiouridine biosynthesis bifunctional protein
LQLRAKDRDLNFEKLTRLMPSLAKAHQIRLREASHSWVGVRVAQKNRQPLVQKMHDVAHPNVWVCTGLGSRGLSLAALCAEALYQAALAGGLGRGFSGGGSRGEHGFSLG